LHPLDLDNPALVESNLAVIDQLLETGAKARTYGTSSSPTDRPPPAA
jgi:hypothetical protein